MVTTTFQQDPSGVSRPQTQSSVPGAADVNIASGYVGIDPTLNGVTVLAPPVASPGPLNASTRALATNLVVSNRSARLFKVNGTNTKVGAQLIQIHDAASLPADGAIPVLAINVAASTAFSIDFGIYGRLFVNGIVVCNSSTAGTKTVGSADILVDAQYA